MRHGTASIFKRATAALAVAALALASCDTAPPATPDVAPQGLLSPGFTHGAPGGGFVGNHDFIPRRPAAHHFTGFIDFEGDSNCVGAANYNATGQADTWYGVSDVTGYAPVLMNSHYATGVTDPVVWVDTGTETLRAYAAPPGLNMGLEQTVGRRLYQRGVATAPIEMKVAVSGSVQHTNWRGDSTVPATGGNLVAQSVAQIKARETEFGRKIDAVVVCLGENDTSSSTNATPTQADIASFVAGIRNGLGRPTLPFFYVLLNSTTTGAFTSTVRAGQVAAIAADPYMRGVYSSDIVLASNPHYGASGYYDLGDRIAHAIAAYYYPGQIFNLEAPSAFPRLQDMGAGYTTAASPATASPRSGPDLQDGDLQLLVVSSQATDPTYTLTTAAGFTALGSGKFQSIFSGTNFRSMIIYWRLVDTATLVANNNQMPVPVIDAGTVASTGAIIFTIRGPNKFVANPVDCFATGANNANTTALPIGGCTTAAANELALVFNSVPGNTGSTVSVVNAALSNIAKRRESLFTQTSTIGIAMHTARVANSNTVIGSTAVTMSAVGNNVGALVTIKP